MKRVYKYPIVKGKAIELPQGSKIVKVGADPQRQHSVWAEVPVDETRSQWHDIRVMGTGWDLPRGGDHLGTFLDGPFVWHVYDFGVVSVSA